MPTMYRRQLSTGFGKTKADSFATSRRTKPLKRPSQARAKFTVQAIFDAFIRIWCARQWEGVTTRAVALETGISVGTLYDYFPNKEALLSGYVRHCMEALLEAIEVQVIQPTDIAWKDRLRRLVELTGALGTPELPYFDLAMLQLENIIAEPKHHRRVFEEFSAKWVKAIEACSDLPRKPQSDVVEILFLSVWGAKRYLMLLERDQTFVMRWIDETTDYACMRISATADTQKQQNETPPSS